MGLFGHFYSPLSILSFFPSLWETARYRLKYCLKGPLTPKPTNLYPPPHNFVVRGDNKCSNHSMHVCGHRAGWLVGCFGLTFQSITGRLLKTGKKKREMIDERKNVQTTPIRTHCKRSRPLPYCSWLVVLGLTAL